MTGVELALAVVATADLCFKYGRLLVKTCENFKHAECEIAERVLRIESCWNKTSLQLDFIKRVWKDLDTYHQNIQSQILQVLVAKLTIALSKLEGLIKKDDTLSYGTQNQSPTRPMPVKRFKYALLKQYLDKTIDDLELWQKTFDPSWFLVMRVASQLIDIELTKEDLSHSTLSTAHHLRDSLKDSPQEISVFLPEDGLRSAHFSDIAFSSAKAVQRTGSAKWLILDHIECDPQANLSVMTKNVRDLARKLSQSDPIMFGLLNCYGVIKVLHPSSRRPAAFNFVFRVPQGMSEPQSLRSRLLTNDIKHSLSDRFRVAKQLAQSISYIHTYGFVHKNIRPETILTFQDGQSPLGSSFLLGFEKFRAADGRTLRTGDSEWYRDLYRHPHRHGLNIEQDYIMQHDIYSLGVCLLELGLWDSFVQYDSDKQNPFLSPNFGMEMDTEHTEVGKGLLVKEHLVGLARNFLPERMGTKYTEVVETCLTCLDEDNSDFGDESEFQDEDGILVGVRYIEKVLLQLDSISI